MPETTGPQLMVSRRFIIHNKPFSILFPQELYVQLLQRLMSVLQLASISFVQAFTVDSHDGWTEVLGFSKQCQLMQRCDKMVKLFLEKELQTGAYIYQEGLLLKGRHDKHSIAQVLHKFCREYDTSFIWTYCRLLALPEVQLRH